MRDTPGLSTMIALTLALAACSTLPTSSATKDLQVAPAYTQEEKDAMTEDTPDTIILVSPIDPYVCIGYHQELEKEVDLAYCKGCGVCFEECPRGIIDMVEEAV